MKWIIVLLFFCSCTSVKMPERTAQSKAQDAQKIKTTILMTAVGMMLFKLVIDFE